MASAIARSRAALLPGRSRPARPARATSRPDDATAGGQPLPPLSPRLQLVRSMLVLVFVMCAALLVHFTLVSSLQRSASQGRAFDRFRLELASGTAPIGPTDSVGRALAIGTPVAHIDIAAIDLQQVVGEGTTSSALLSGPGHRRDTPLPGQVGTSVLFGRRAAFGGPFSDISELKMGDPIVVTTGQGVFTYRVSGMRVEGDPLPPPLAAGGSRLMLVTAAGWPFMPDGVLRVDADLDGAAVGGAPRLISAAALPAEERVMAGDSRTLWVLVLWLQVLIALSIGVVAAWHRWSRPHAWIIFVPPLLLVGLATAGEIARFLPNLL